MCASRHFLGMSIGQPVVCLCYALYVDENCTASLPSQGGCCCFLFSIALIILLVCDHLFSMILSFWLLPTLHACVVTGCTCHTAGISSLSHTSRGKTSLRKITQNVPQEAYKYLTRAIPQELKPHTSYRLVIPSSHDEPCIQSLYPPHNLFTECSHM